MKENPNFDPKVESISNIDELVSWWKKGNHEDQSYLTRLSSLFKPDPYLSKYDLFNDMVKRRGINVEKLASYCNKKIIEIDDRIKEYQTYWKVFMLTIITGCFLSLLPSVQDIIFKIFEKEHTEDVSTLFTALTLYWGLIAEVLALLFLIYIIVMIFIRVIYSSYANRKTYHSLFTLSNSFMIF